mmetsp:Transcript_1190/g.1909  ORF Transcript_1190/g.1909 Transcript_1190/m.1909 type:complete len:109 (+) Transcript_1190:81-407(+)
MYRSYMKQIFNKEPSQTKDSIETPPIQNQTYKNVQVGESTIYVCRTEVVGFKAFQNFPVGCTLLSESRLWSCSRKQRLPTKQPTKQPNPTDIPRSVNTEYLAKHPGQS